jgi:hypothetical protein
MSFKIVIEPRAIFDIQEAVDYYDFKQIGLGEYFIQALEEHIEILRKNPFFQIRYKDYYGLPIKKFPFIIFYFTDEEVKIVYVVSVFNTSLNPKKYIWDVRKKNSTSRPGIRGNICRSFVNLGKLRKHQGKHL